MHYILIVFAGYGLSVGLTLWGVKLLPLPRADAVLAGILFATLFFAAITMILFWAERRGRGDGLRPAMGWLHRWSGLLVGWVLFFTFLTGSTGYFDTEIDRWMQPERPLRQEVVSVADIASRSLAYLMQTAPRAERWIIAFPGTRSYGLRLFWQNPPGEDNGSVSLDPATGVPIVYRDTGGGQLLYRMHWQLHYLPRLAGEWIVIICALVMLAAIISGVITHKRIFRDFFTFRPRKGQRSWLDAHNLLGVAALPFHIMITYSGLLFYGYLYMAPVIAATYGEERATYFAELFGRSDLPDRSGRAAALVPVVPLLQQDATAAHPIQFIIIYNPGDANARIVVQGGPFTPTRSYTELTFDGITGDLLHASGPRSAPLAVRDTLINLHEGLFAGPGLRWLYFLSGLAGTAMIGGGLVLWAVKRRERGGAGLWLVEGLNLGTIIGLPTAIAAYFWANRLIPVGIEGRAAWEAHSLFITWALMLLHAFLRPGRRGWREQLCLAAAAFGLLPLLNALTTDRHLGITLPAGVWELAGFDLTMLAIGLAFAATAWRVGQHERR